MCFNSSSSSASSSSSDVHDQRIGADNGAVAIRQLAGGNADLTFNSLDADVAQFAIEGSTAALKTSVDFLGDTFSKVLTASEKSVERASNNVSATRDFAAGLIDKEQQTADDRLIKVMGFGATAVAVVFVVQSGAIKDLKGVFK